MVHIIACILYYCYVDRSVTVGVWLLICYVVIVCIFMFMMVELLLRYCADFDCCLP